MTDNFKIKMVRALANDTDVWRELARIEAAIKEIEAGAGDVTWEEHSLTAEGRTWERNDHAELEKIAKSHELTEFVVYFDYAVGKRRHQWAANAFIYAEHQSDIEVDAYGGEDRMATEQVAKAMRDAVKPDGIEFVVRATEVLSTDRVRKSKREGSEAPVTEAPPDPAPVGVAAPEPAKEGFWRRLGSLIAAHVPTFVVTVVGGLLVIAIAVWLRLAPAG